MASSSTPKCVGQLIKHLSEALKASVSHHPLVSGPNEFADGGTRYTIGFAANQGPYGANQYATLNTDHGAQLYLYLNMLVAVKSKRKCDVVTYNYALCSKPDDDSRIVRWEFLRNKPSDDYQYVRSHTHVHGSWSTELAPPNRREHHIHIPSGDRISVEQICWHLITDWDVTPIKNDWRRTLIKGAEKFYDERTLKGPWISEFS